jgi:hypothetical protein
MILPENLTGSQQVKKFPKLCGTRKFITALITVPLSAPVLKQIIPVHVPILLEDPF